MCACTAGLLDLHKVVSFTLTVNPMRRYPPIRTMRQLGAKTAGAKEGRWGSDQGLRNSQSTV